MGGKGEGLEPIPWRVALDFVYTPTTSSNLTAKKREERMGTNVARRPRRELARFAVRSKKKRKKRERKRGGEQESGNHRFLFMFLGAVAVSGESRGKEKKRREESTTG